MSNLISHRMAPVLLCGWTGLLGGLALTLSVHGTVVMGPVLGLVYGLLFALLFSNRAIGRGAGLIWGLGYALLLWLAVPAGIQQVISGGVSSMGALQSCRDNFPELVGYIVCFGMPLGLVV